MVKTYVKKTALLLASFLIPVIVMTLVYKNIGIFPFGDKCLLPYWDIREQYSNYFAYLQTIFSGENNFLYSFSKTLGGDMIGLTAYYLASPLNILFAVLKNIDIVDIILILTLIRVGLNGVTCFIYLKSNNKSPFRCLIFSSCYALMAYNIAYQQNPMWIDGVILLPIICLGIDKFINENKPVTYVSSLSLAIFSNYYIGWMLGIFSFLYFIAKLMLKLPYKKAFKKLMVPFCLYSLLSIGLVSFFLIPTLFSLSGGKGPLSNGVEDLLDFYFYLSPKYFIYKLCPGAFNWNDLMYGEPLVFCGALPIIFAIIYFFDRSVSKKEKIVYLSLLMFFILSFGLGFLNVLWHGLNAPTGFPFRNSFIFSFLVIIIACRSFESFEKNVKIYYTIPICIFVLFLCNVIMSSEELCFEEKFIRCSLLVIATCAVFILLMYINFKISKGICVSCLLAICLFDLYSNACKTFEKYSFINHNNMSNFVKDNIDIVNAAKEIDPDFYRIEKTFARTRNDNMLLNIPGVSHYSSSEKDYIKHLMGALGYDQYGDVYCAYGKGSTVLADSLLGIRYLISTLDLEKERGYIPLNKINDKTIYKNPYALNIGTVVNNDVINKNIIDDNRFEFQNQVFKHMSGIDEDIFKKVEDIDVKFNNLEVTKYGRLKILKKIDHRKSASIICKLDQVKDNVFLDAWSEQPNNVQIFLNGRSMDNFFDGNKKNLIKLPKENEYTLEVLVNVQQIIIRELSFYYEDLNALKAHVENLNKSICKVNKESSSRLLAEVTVEEPNKMMLLTVPYESGWKVKIDGKPVQTEKVFYNLTALPIEQGEHVVEMYYIPKGLYLGISFSALSWMIFIIINAKRSRWKSLQIKTQGKRTSMVK